MEVPRAAGETTMTGEQAAAEETTTTDDLRFETLHIHLAVIIARRTETDDAAGAEVLTEEILETDRMTGIGKATEPDLLVIGTEIFEVRLVFTGIIMAWLR